MNTTILADNRWYIHALEKEIAKSPLQIDSIGKKEKYIRDWNNARMEMLNEQLALYRKGEGRLN